MNRSVAMTLSCLMIATVFSVVTVAAETRDIKEKEIRGRITELKKTLMGRSLDMDEATLNRIIDLTDRYDEKRKSINTQRKDDLKALFTALKTEEPKDSEIKALIDKLSKSEDELFSLRKQEQKELSMILTPSQMGRYLVFMEKFNRNVRKIIAGKRIRPGDEKPKR